MKLMIMAVILVMITAVMITCSLACQLRTHWDGYIQP